jgi:hypothetical protein
MTRKELEAENAVLRAALQAVEDEARYQHERRSGVGNHWLVDHVHKAWNDAKAARKNAAAECQPVPAEERRARAYNAFL